MADSPSVKIQTAFTQLMGIQHPLVLAPMALVAGGKLAAAVSRAGGLGLIGGGYGDAMLLEEQFALSEGQPVGVGFITWALAEQPTLLDMALSHKPVAVMLSFGDLSIFAPKIKAAGCTLIAQVQSVEAALLAKAQGADVIIAQGTEAGGHGGERATLPLVPAVVDAVGELPVLAAGGIADGRGLAASLMLGASGALLGSRFYASDESMVPDPAKAKAVQSSGDQTLRSDVFDVLREKHWPAPYKLRSLRNQMTERWHGDSAALKADLKAQKTLFQQAVSEQDYATAPTIVGEAADLINSVSSAADIVESICHEATAALQSPRHFELIES